jgi:hypothetical protein
MYKARPYHVILRAFSSNIPGISIMETRCAVSVFGHADAIGHLLAEGLDIDPRCRKVR